MKTTLFYIKILLILCCGLMTASCGASKQRAMLDTINSPQGRPPTFEALSEDFAIAEKDQVNLISPEKYLEAKQLFQEAEKMEAAGQPADKYKDKLSEARGHLDYAIAFTKENKDIMSPLMQEREATLTSGAAETKNDDLEKLEKKYLELVSDLNSKDSRKEALGTISNLTHDYKNLTIKTPQRHGLTG
jgi:hypothetical protein